MADFTIKRGDTLPSIQSTLTHSDNSGGLASASSVKFIMRLPYTNTPKVRAAATLVEVSDTTLVVRYDWVSGDTNVADEYRAEWEVTFASGKIETFPNDGYNIIQVFQDLG
jgi:hypothetical protein